MPPDMSPNGPEGDEQGRAGRPPRTARVRQLRQWYYTAKRLQENGENEDALSYFKRIYENEYDYEDVAKIVEDSYLD